jgi:Protein of unknown function, DUF624
MKTDWRDTVRVASDVAVLGLLMVVASLPVVTTGAAFATASAAVHHFLTHDRWPPWRTTWQVFRRTLLPGALATAAVAAAVALVVIDVAGVSGGRVPGGGLLLAATVLIATAAAGYAALTVVALGSRPDGGWRSAARAAAAARPATVAAAAGVVALAALLAVLVHPILAACLVGYALYALHAVVRRLAAPPDAATLRR